MSPSDVFLLAKQQGWPAKLEKQERILQCRVYFPKQAGEQPVHEFYEATWRARNVRQQDQHETQLVFYA